VRPGRRALGVAESYRAETSTLAASVVRADRVVDGVAFGTCTVGGTDATAAILDIFDRLDREDIAYLLVAGIAPAWFNILDLHRLHDVTGLPALSVSFEESTGLASAIRDAFEGDEMDGRLARYRAQPPRHAVGDGTVYVRGVGCDETEMTRVVRAFTPEGSSRPEPLRVARLAARAADRFRKE
jgi:endonuclease V-like protein UPF0215 family